MIFQGSGNIYHEVTTAPSQLRKVERFHHVNLCITLYLSTLWVIQISHWPFTSVTFDLEHIPCVYGFVPSSALSFLGLIFCLFPKSPNFYRYASKGGANRKQAS